MKSSPCYRRNEKMMALFAVAMFIASTATFGASRQPPFDKQTLAVLRIDAEKIDVTSWVEGVSSVLAGDGERSTDSTLTSVVDHYAARARTHLNAFRRAGGKECYVLFSLSDIPGLYAAIPEPVQGETLIDRIKATLNDLGIRGASVDTHQGFILVGAERMVERLKMQRPIQSSTYAAALASCGDTPLQCVLLPTPDQRRVLAESVPLLSAVAGSGETGLTPQDFEWLAMGIAAQPELSLDLTLQAGSVVGAEKIRGMLAMALANLTVHAQMQSALAGIQPLLNTLGPHREGSQLRLQVDQATAAKLLSRALLPAVQNSKQKAMRLSCMHQLKEIGLACFIYANRHENRFPPALNVLSAAGQLTDAKLACPATLASDSFVYRGDDLSVAHSPRMVVACDQAENHGDKGRNVLFLDGHVEWMTAQAFAEAIERDNELRRQENLTVKAVP